MIAPERSSSDKKNLWNKIESKNAEAAQVMADKKNTVLLFKMNFMIKNEGVKRFSYNGGIHCLSPKKWK